MANHIAQTILRQLGGNKFIAMTGCKDFVAGENSLKFKLPKKLNAITHVLITLDINDTYRMEFLSWSAKKLQMRIECVKSDVYADQMREIFEDQTGLLTSL